MGRPDLDGLTVRPWSWFALVVLTATLVGCAAEEALSPVEEPVISDPAVMRIEPATAAPGEEVEAIFPRGDGRTGGFWLEVLTEEGWRWRWSVSSDPEGSNPSVLTREEWVERNFEWDSGPSFDTTQSHPIPIPARAESGSYRLCTAANQPPLCAEFEVVEGADP